MPVDLAWVERNLGAPAAEGIMGRAAAIRETNGGDDRALARDLIEFDSEGADGAAFRAVAPRSKGLSEFVDVDWPAGVAPTPGERPAGESLPDADVLVVTWTMDEGHALSRVLTPGFDTRDDWKPYTKNFDAISTHMIPRSPARQYGRLGTYWTTRIGERQVTLFKSDSHMSQDGPDLANATVFRQLIEDCSPDWVITTGTGGGIGAEFEVGDVVVSRFVSFDCHKAFAHLDGKSFACDVDAPSDQFATAKALFGANAPFLPSDNSRPPKIASSGSAKTGILTTDFFGFDNSDDTFGLQGRGYLSEMGDAVLGMVCQELGASAPKYTIVRNVSDPQIDASSLTIAEQKQLAATIYQAYGRWSTVCSAIVCWAIIAE
jgi:nucleoside phosphorylase